MSHIFGSLLQGFGTETQNSLISLTTARSSVIPNKVWVKWTKKRGHVTRWSVCVILLMTSCFGTNWTLSPREPRSMGCELESRPDTEDISVTRPHCTAPTCPRAVLLLCWVLSFKVSWLEYRKCAVCSGTCCLVITTSCRNPNIWTDLRQVSQVGAADGDWTLNLWDVN